MSERTLHGVRFELPDDWEDWSSFRFAPPRLEARLPSIAKTDRLGANFSVARLTRTLASLEAQLQAMNEELELTVGELRVLAAGALMYRGQRALWQDLALTYQGQPVHQRHLLLPGEGTTVVLVTMTGDRQQLGVMSKSIGLEVPG